jgi:hypothetical protein
VTQQTFDAGAEAKNLYNLSKSPDRTAFQKEMTALKGDPAHYAATIKEIETQEKQREAFAQQNMSPGSKLHELKIVHDLKTGAVKEIDAKEVPVEKIGHDESLPKVVLYQPRDGAPVNGPVPARTGVESGKPAENNEAAQRAAAAKEQAARDAAAREAQQKTQAEATNLLTKLQNHDTPGFAKEYNSLSDSDKAAVGRAMQMQLQQSHERETRIAQNPDGSISGVEKNGKLEYITPSDFINSAIDKKDPGALSAYYKSLSPDGKKEFSAALQKEAAKHNVRVELDDDGNLKQINDANGKKVYPEGKFGSILHKAEKVHVQIHP